MESNSKTKLVSHAIGRRKTAIASVRVYTGTGEIVVNDKPASKYFPGALSQSRLLLPFTTLDLSKYTATVRVHGGGYESQLDATVLGLARSLAEIKADFQVAMRNAGLLTRDPRERQRRMVGMGGKSRRRKQSPKR